MSITTVAEKHESRPVLDQPPPANPRRPWLWLWVRGVLSFGLAVGMIVAVVSFGHGQNWKMPKFSTLMGWNAAQADDWCAEHAVPESICVECRQARQASGGKKAEGFGWCKKHGVHECPLCHPEVAQLVSTSTGVSDLVARFDEADGIGERVANNSKCKLHQRLLQFASAEAASKAGVRVGLVASSALIEAVQAPGEVSFDPTTVARVSARRSGTARRVDVRQGDRVRRGDVLALIDSPDVGKARAEWSQARLRVEAETKSLATLKTLSGTIPERRLRDAQAALDEATIQVNIAEQTLANLGLAAEGKTSGFMPVVAPRDGVITQRNIAPGETVEAGKTLFVVADPERLWLTLRVKQEDVGRLRPGLTVRFTSEGTTGTGPITWIGREIDEKTRTVPVRATLNASGERLRASQFGTGQIVLREVGSTLTVPAEAVHWEGCCHVVFVRDKGYDEPDAPKVFHVRKVQPGVAERGRTEILAGLLPGETIATTGSGLLQGELLRNNLGAG